MSEDFCLQKARWRSNKSHPKIDYPADGTVINWCHCNAWWYCAHIEKVREGESVLLPDENASSLFSTCNVLSHSSHLVPITLGIQAATKLHIAAKHPNEHGRKCHTIHHLLPMESRTLQRGDMVVFFSVLRGPAAGQPLWLPLVRREEMTPTADDPASSSSSLAGK